MAVVADQGSSAEDQRTSEWVAGSDFTQYPPDVEEWGGMVAELRRLYPHLMIRQRTEAENRDLISHERRASV